MKRTFTLVIGMLFALNIIIAQEAPPYAFSYKAVITNSKGNIVANKVISLKITILQGSTIGVPVYSEIFNPTTSATGQINVVIGQGAAGDLSSVNWSADKYFLKTEVDIKGGTAYLLLSEPTELLSVPYSLYAGEAGNGFATIYTNTEKRPILSDVGNIGIGGPVDPNWKLNVYGGAKAGWLSVGGSIGMSGALWANPGSSTFGTVISLNSKTLEGGADFWIASLGGNAYEGQGKLMIKATMSTTDNSFIMDREGKVGLGLPNFTPAYRLDVNGDINFTGNLFKNGTPFGNSVGSSTHSIGESYGGGIVFYITPDGMHGLVAATQDQSSESTWYEAQNNISNPSNHNTEGKKYTDWRMPTKYELNLLYLQRSVVGGFSDYGYLSSTEVNSSTVWGQAFASGNQLGASKDYAANVRAIRAF